MGAEIRFDIDGVDEDISVFTTRPDTIFGATFMVLAPEHPLVDHFTSDAQSDAVAKYRQEAAHLSLFSSIEFCLWDAWDDATNFQRNFSIGEVEVEGGVGAELVTALLGIVIRLVGIAWRAALLVDVPLVGVPLGQGYLFGRPAPLRRSL